MTSRRDGRPDVLDAWRCSGQCLPSGTEGPRLLSRAERAASCSSRQNPPIPEEARPPVSRPTEAIRFEIVRPPSERNVLIRNFPGGTRLLRGGSVEHHLARHDLHLRPLTHTFVLPPLLAQAVLLLLLLVSSSHSAASVLEGTVVNIADGDTITILDSNKVQHRIASQASTHRRKGNLLETHLGSG